MITAATKIQLRLFAGIVWSFPAEVTAGGRSWPPVNILTCNSSRQKPGRHVGMEFRHWHKQTTAKKILNILTMS